MNWIVATILLLSSVSFTFGETNRPRGVSLKDSHLYDESNESFQCLDGSKNIPFEAVNDDYCDCKDGSDEPGTSACSNGKFYCINTGYVSKTVPSSIVNDNICDCCDGSDEWESQVTCPNICESLGAEARVKAAQKLEIIKEGWEKRQQFVKEGEKLYAEKSESIETVKQGIEKLKEEREKLENEQKPYIEKEKELKEKADKEWDDRVKESKMASAKTLFETFDTNKDGKITLDEVKKIPQADTDGNKEVSDEEAKSFLRDNEEVDLEKFTSDAYDFIRDLMKIKSIKVESEEDHGDVDSGKEEKETGDKEKKEEDQDKFKDIDLQGNEDYDKEDDKHDSRENDKGTYEPEDNYGLGRKPEYDEETKAVIAEADRYREEIRELSNKIFAEEENMRDDEKFLGINFDEDKAWASLYKKCFELNQKQYTYKVCLFDKTTQKDSSGYGDVSLGSWDNWVEQDVNPFKIQNYNNGQSCWNGPNRSTKVIIECGKETELVDATEPSKCEYFFTLKTPVACPDPSTVNLHDEL